MSIEQRQEILSLTQEKVKLDSQALHQISVECLFSPVSGYVNIWQRNSLVRVPMWASDQENLTSTILLLQTKFQNNPTKLTSMKSTYNNLFIDDLKQVHDNLSRKKALERLKGASCSNQVNQANRYDLLSTSNNVKVAQLRQRGLPMLCGI